MDNIFSTFGKFSLSASARNGFKFSPFARAQAEFINSMIAPKI